jgi:hypothetical protein
MLYCRGAGDVHVEFMSGDMNVIWFGNSSPCRAISDSRRSKSCGYPNVARKMRSAKQGPDPLLVISRLSVGAMRCLRLS